MSTQKKNTAAKKAETTTTQKDESLGTQVIHHRSICMDKDGNTRDATPQEMAAAKGAYITVASKTDDGIKVVDTYDCRIHHYDNGNIGLFIRTSDSLDDAEMDNPVAKDLGEGVGKNDKITLVGRGNTLGAAFALVNCCRAYGSQFGQELAYRMVKMTLDRDTKCWHGLFVPALAIASM